MTFSNVHIKLFQESDAEQLFSYSLSQEQMNFTALPKLALDRISKRKTQGDNNANGFTIMVDQLQIGFFVLDIGNDLALWTDNKAAIFLRSLSINPLFQGQGIGTKVIEMLPMLIKQHYNETINEIVLGVNFDNLKAKNLYQNLGYRELGLNMNPPFVGQVIMKKSIAL